MTNILYHVGHRPMNREEAVVEGSNGVSATSSDKNVERSEAVTETMDGSEARAALLSVIRTNCFACAVSDDDDDDEDEKEEKKVLVGKEIQQRNLGNSSSGVSGGVRRGEKAKKKEVLDLADISTKPNLCRNILGASSSGSVSDVQKKVVLDSGETSSHRPNSRLRTRPNRRLSNPPNHLNGELVAAGWPSWLCAVAGEAIYGWTPRRADSFEKIDKIGQGLRSNVYKGRDAMTGKIVALKKVRFDNLEPESVKFMAREILVLRRLDHPNVMKLEGLVTSKMSCSLYLVFEYMEHDLAGLAGNPGIKFTEPQVKCYMQQLFLGIEYCHSHGVLHRDINLSNLLIDNGGILKIAGFGSASFFDPNHKLPMTSRVTTLWYRPPELLLGATDYGVGVDLWSIGCVLAELLAGKPIMPGRKEVEQLHKIFKLCGSPSEEYWKKSKLPHATIFKPRQRHCIAETFKDFKDFKDYTKRCIAETFKDFPPSTLPLIETLLAIDPIERQTATAALTSEFFTTKPYACEPSSLPKYPPSKEMDAKLRDEEARRLRAAGKANGDGVKPIRKVVLDSGETSSHRPNSRLRTRPNRRLSNPPNHLNGELVAAGWPSWLCAVAGEAIYGWTPRRADSFENLNKIGRGTRSKLYEAKDILTGKIVTLKKVEFDSLKPESVQLMAKEILMLRRLDHPNVIKLEGVMISKKSCGLYLVLVFQYMEHDLAGLAANKKEIRFTESQVKCFMHQLLSGLKHCHDRGVLHRDINGSHLLIDDGGILKIAGFGSASLFDSKYKQDLTNRVDNLWYLSPEILLGATACGVGVDLWSTGCILAELLGGKAIMPGRIQVDQLHKIFELCGFSSEEFWEKSNLPHATVFKPFSPYRRRIENRFKHFPPSSLPLIKTFLAIDPVERGTTTSALRSEFFKTQPYACDPSSLPKYPPKQKMGTSEKKNEKKIDAILLDRELEEIINGESLVHHGLIDKKGFLVLRTDILRTRDAISTWGVRIIDAS